MLHKQQEQTGSTVLLSSHLLGEVEKVAHRVGIIREGTIVEVATIKQLKRMALKEIKVEFVSTKGLQEFSNKLTSEKVEEVILNDTHASFLMSREELSKVLRLLSEADIIDTEITSPALEDIFLKYYQVPSSQENKPMKRKEVES
ncbi:Multidrug efflux system ATP-binding protein [subsurface metagenome]